MSKPTDDQIDRQLMYLGVRPPADPSLREAVAYWMEAHWSFDDMRRAITGDPFHLQRS